jgi:hypothetical protein
MDGMVQNEQACLQPSLIFNQAYDGPVLSKRPDCLGSGRPRRLASKAGQSARQALFNHKSTSGSSGASSRSVYRPTMQPATTSSGRFTIVRISSIVSTMVLTDSRTAVFMKPQVFMKTKSASARVSTMHI